MKLIHFNPEEKRKSQNSSEKIISPKSSAQLLSEAFKALEKIKTN